MVISNERRITQSGGISARTRRAGTVLPLRCVISRYFSPLEYAQNALLNGKTASSRGHAIEGSRPSAILGGLGIHRFYVGKVGTGVLQLLTLGGLGIWALIDFIIIIMGKFTDKEGKTLAEWN